MLQTTENLSGRDDRACWEGCDSEWEGELTHFDNDRVSIDSPLGTFVSTGNTPGEVIITSLAAWIVGNTQCSMLSSYLMCYCSRSRSQLYRYALHCKLAHAVKLTVRLTYSGFLDSCSGTFCLEHADVLQVMPPPTYETRRLTSLQLTLAYYCCLKDL